MESQLCNECGWEDPEKDFTVRGAITLCRYCSQPDLSPESVRRERLKAKLKKRSTERRDKMEERLTRAMDPDYMEKLSADSPEFFKALQEFEEGNYDLEDGTKDGFLSFVSRRVQSGEIIESFMEKKFRDRCSYYCEQRYSGEDLKPFEMKGEQVEEAFQTCFAREDLLPEKDQTILKSIRAQYLKRGWITAKQLLMLHIFREKK